MEKNEFVLYEINLEVEEKKDNLVSIGTWVLIGKRDWETTRDGKLENCDLLVVYREDEKKLMQICDFDFTAICKNNETTNTIIEDDCSIQFVDSKTQEYLNAAEQNIREKNKKIKAIKHLMKKWFMMIMVI